MVPVSGSHGKKGDGESLAIREKGPQVARDEDGLYLFWERGAVVRQQEKL